MLLLEKCLCLVWMPAVACVRRVSCRLLRLEEVHVVPDMDVQVHGCW